MGHCHVEQPSMYKSLGLRPLLLEQSQVTGKVISANGIYRPKAEVGICLKGAMSSI